MEWIRTAKLKKYDVISAFKDLEEIDWRKSGFGIETDDIVYIYVGKPYSRIMYKTICILDSVDSEEKAIEDNKYWVEKEDNDEIYECVRLKLLESYDDEKLSLDTLTELEYIKGRIQGAYKSENYPELFQYINEICNQYTNSKMDKILEVGNTDMIFHTITDALNYCFNADINYVYQKGTYPAKKNAWQYYMAWFPHFAFSENGKLRTGSKTLDSNWYNIINEEGTIIEEFNYGVPKEKYEAEKDFYRLVFGKNKNEEYKFVGVFRMIIPYDDGKNYAYRKYEKVTGVFDTSKILLKPDFEFDTAYVGQAYKIPNISETERNILAKARIGQGLYRENLILKHECKCMLCGLGYKELLIASHIKEWSKAKNEERVDVNNGLLLCTLHDSLFDKHLITFDKDGKIIISSRLTQKDMMLCNISSNSKIEMTPEIEKYMEFHRNMFFDENNVAI